MNRIQLSTLRRRGMSMIEVMIATLIFAMVLAFVVYVTFFVGKNINVLSAESKAEMDGRNAAELIRMHLQMAKLGTITISNSNRTITWKNPEFGANNSQLVFSPAVNNNGSLALTNPNGFSRNIDGLANVQFTTRNFGALIDVTVQTQGNALGGDKVIPVSQTFTVRPRN